MRKKTNTSLKERLALKNKLVKEILAEFLGTFILIVLGLSSIAQATLSGGTKGDILTVNISFSIAVAMAVYVAGGISGGHVNPAVSLAMCVLGRLEWKKLPLYVIFQFLGAFVGSATVFGVYYEALMNYSGGILTVTGPNATAHIFATYPAPYLSIMGGFVDQVIGTALLLLVILALFDNNNLRVPKGLEPVVISLHILLLGLALGMNCGCALNPARDLSPRIFTAVAGWGMEVFSAGNNWWWVPVVAPSIGAITGALLYELFIELHHPQTHKDSEVEYEMTKNVM
ncbi:aquaporin-9 isoform X2 [Protopterus annectens]|uniref:aquaporin-9 isoform X2 n=1 Tax=Protopterus annectens TaxID=7888 RepID=UPI001CFA7DFC|nr:aquaporin-9 isoform X2 [Protopterus annectens]